MSRLYRDGATETPRASLLGWLGCLAGRDLMDLTSAAKSKIPARQITDSWASNALAVGSRSSRRAGTEAGICSDEENGVDLGSPADCRYRCEFLKRNSQGRGR